MVARVSQAQRVTLAHRAQAEIERYADDHAAWHKHVHGVELDPMQVLKCIEMDAHPNSIDFSCRRTGKTAVKELHALKYLATHPHQELGVVAPRLQQSTGNINYHLDAIRRSPILRNYVAWKSGREQLSDTRFAFVNHSRGAAYGIMSQIDGDAISYASIEEVDDMPADRLFARFLPMLGSARRLGATREASFKPQIRITGVFKGADTLQRFIDSGSYHGLPIVDMYLGLELGVLNREFVEQMRTDMSEGEFIRQYLCRNVSSQHHIWEKFVRLAQQVGLKAGLEIAGPLPGLRYRKRGLLSFGYDHTGHGEALTASKSALVVCEQLGNFVTIPYVRQWPAGTDDALIMRDLAGLWDYFRPDCAYGDAYGVGMLTTLNDHLFAHGLTEIDRRSVGDGQSTASTWSGWPFAPIRFEGMTKHAMATALRSCFHNSTAAIPYFDAEDPAMADWAALIRQLPNMKAEATKASYASYKMAEPKLGDDLFDAACAAVFALVTRGVIELPALLAHRTRTREQLLGLPAPMKVAA